MRLAARGKRGDQRVAARIEQAVLGHRARRDDTHHGPLHRPFALADFTDLLADRDRQALAHEAREVGVEGGDRHARHDHRLAARLAARRQRDVQQFRGAAGIVIEQFVEVAHAVEHEDRRVFTLDLQVLLHHRRVAGGCIHEGAYACSPDFGGSSAGDGPRYGPQPMIHPRVGRRCRAAMPTAARAAVRTLGDAWQAGPMPARLARC